MSKLLTPLEIAALKVEIRQMHNEVNWAFVDGPNRTYDDIGLQPRASVDDEELLAETEVELEEAYAWLLGLETE